MAMAVTHISAATAALVWLVIEWVKFDKPSIVGIPPARWLALPRLRLLQVTLALPARSFSELWEGASAM